MSISSMTERAVVRQTQPPAQTSTPAETPRPGTPTTATSTTTGATQMAGVLATITAYIPTEILTLYVAVRAALSEAVKPGAGGASAALTAAGGVWPERIAFYGFLALTPTVVWLVYATRLKSAGQPLPLAPPAWPWWEMAAATVAYVAWAFGLPNSVFNAWPYYSTSIAAVLVLVTSSLLALLTPVFSTSKG